MTNQQTISAIIIDDEPQAIHLLEIYLRHFRSIEVIGKETHAKEGLKLIREMLPDLVFLDIDMPEMNGLQIAHKIQDDNFQSEIVFTTAHKHYAYEALDIEPLDFLTKPFCIEDLEIVLKKYQAKAEKKKLERKLERFIHQKENPLKIKLPSSNGILLIDTRDIVLIKSNSKNCTIYLQDGQVETISRNLSVMMELLNSPVFYPISRQAIININYLKGLDKKNSKCILYFNQSSQSEIITKNFLQSFEKLDFFQAIQDTTSQQD